MFAIKRFGTTLLPVTRPVQDQGTGKVGNVKFLPLPGGGSYRTLGNATANVGGGYGMTVTGAISDWSQSAAAFETQERAIRALIGTSEKLYRQWENSGDWEWVKATLASVDYKRSDANKNHVDISLNFTVESANWWGARHGAGWTFDSGELFDTGLEFDLGSGDVFVLTSNPQTITVANNGNLPVRNAVLSLVGAASNPTTTFTVTNAATYCKFAYTGTLAATKTLVIDSGQCKVTNDGTDDYANFALNGSNHKNDSWLVLNPGNNSIVVACDSAGDSPTLTVAFYDAWA